MNQQMILFLASRPQIREVLLILGTGSDLGLVRELCCQTSLERLTIFLPTPAMQTAAREMLDICRCRDDGRMPAAISLADWEQVLAYQPADPGYALVFDEPDSGDRLMELTALHPAFLVGSLGSCRTEAFTLWQAWRANVGQMYLLSAQHGGECLDWTRREDSDIELSVIFPMYKVADYLPQCVESVLAWQAPFVEYLFVDDGSPDNCADIIRRYAEKDTRVRLLQKPNGGCASARQYGLENARGRYVGFVDPDDYIDPSMYRKLLGRALTGSYEVCYCGYRELYESTGGTRDIPDMLGGVYSEGTSNSDRINELISNLRIAIWRGIYLRDLLTRNGIGFYTDLRRFDDLPFQIEVLSKARSVAAVPEYLYYYRLARPGQDVSADDERLYVHFPIFRYLDDFLRRSTDRKQLDNLQVVKIHTHRYALEKIRPEFLREYCLRAKADVRSNFRFWEGAYILRYGASFDDMKYYLALYMGWPSLVRWMRRPRPEARNRDAAAMRRLRKLALK